MNDFDRRQLAGLRGGDRRDYYLRHEKDGSVTVITWTRNTERRQNCRSMAEFKNEVTRILENKQAVIEIKES